MSICSTVRFKKKKKQKKKKHGYLNCYHHHSTGSHGKSWARTVERTKSVHRNDDNVVGYTDADSAMQEHHHAILGCAFLIDRGTISWSSKKQELEMLSTTEVEYAAVMPLKKLYVLASQFIARVTARVYGSYAILL